MRTVEKIAAICASLLSSGAAFASESSSGGMSISATVPEICQLDASNVILTPSDTRTVVTVFEMCNGTSGFRIIASHRDLGVEEHVQIDYGGQITDLQPSGISDIAFRYGPFVGEQQVAIETANLKQGIAISLGMTPI